MGGRTILATVYSPRMTTAGLVTFYVANVVAALRAVVDEVRTRARRPLLDSDFGGEIRGSFDALFGDEG